MMALGAAVLVGALFGVLASGHHTRQRPVGAS
jgi:hypothetical protein